MSDNAAQFNFYLNRQGVTGKQGAKGEKGFSPVISVEKDTLSEYILRITNESSYFLTTNLRESKEDRGGTYIRYDRDQGVMYAGDADRANKTQYGEVRFATAEEIAVGDENTVITPADLEDATANFVTTDTRQDINGVKTFTTQVEVQPSLVVRPMGGTSTSLARTRIGANNNNGYIQFYNSKNENAEIGIYNDFDGVNMYLQAPFQGDKLIINNYGGESAPTGNAKDVVIYGNLINKNNDVASQVLNQDNVTAGDNITIDKTSTGITINATGGGQVPEDVALKSADQTFTGHNWFNGQVNFNSTVQFTNQQVEIPNLHSSNKIVGTNISLDSAGQSFKFPCEKGTMSLSATSGDEAGTSAGLYITGAGIDNKRLLTEGDAYVLPQANATTLGGIKANPKTDEDTQAVNIDPATGLLYTKAGGGNITSIDGGNAQTDEPVVLKASNVDLGIYPTNNIYSTNENITIE